MDRGRHGGREVLAEDLIGAMSARLINAALTAIGAVLLLAFVAVLAWGYVDCEQRGGVLVPGVLWFECLRLLP